MLTTDRRTVLAGLAAAPLAQGARIKEPITIFQAKKIVTMERSLPHAKFLATAGGRVLALANSLDDLSAWTDGRLPLVRKDFADKVLFPGLVEPHLHPMQAAVMLNVPFLAPDDWDLPTGRWSGVSGQNAYRSRLAEIIQQTADNPVVVWGHHELFHGPLDRQALDQIETTRPVFVWQRSFHDIYANSKALEWMGLKDKTAFFEAVKAGGAKEEHADFERGIFSETALQVAISKLQPVLLAPKKLQAGFGHMLNMMHARGVTTAADMATGIFARFETEAGLIANAFGRADTRARAMLMPMAAELDHVDDLAAWMANARKHTSDTVILDKRIKLFADGAFFAQNMRMGEPGYSDGHLGKWLTEPETLRTQLSRYWDKGFSLHIHVNGDEGADVVLDGIARLAPKRSQQITLEHLGYCTEAQTRRIAQMGLMVSAQPNYIRVLGEAYGKRGFGPDRAALMNRLGSLERGGVPLGLHSDFNMAPIDPFYLAWIAQSREGLDGKARGLAERISREKALRAITIEAAQVIGMDAQIGSLAAGKKADFVALEEDPFETDLATMKAMPIAATVFEGRV